MKARILVQECEVEGRTSGTSVSRDADHNQDQNVCLTETTTLMCQWVGTETGICDDPTEGMDAITS